MFQSVSLHLWNYLCACVVTSPFPFLRWVETQIWSLKMIWCYSFPPLPQMSRRHVMHGGRRLGMRFGPTLEPWDATLWLDTLNLLAYGKSPPSQMFWELSVCIVFKDELGQLAFRLPYVTSLPYQATLLSLQLAYNQGRLKQPACCWQS